MTTVTLNAAAISRPLRRVRAGTVAYGSGMNPKHLELLVSEDWRMLLKDYLLPFAFGDRSHGDLGDEVLEIGPGPGLTTDLLRGDLVKLTAIELDPKLASALSDRLMGTNVDIVEGDATAMPFEPARFTGAIALTMFHHVPTVELQDRLFAEIFRVLRPGGLLVASDSVASEDLAALTSTTSTIPWIPRRCPVASRRSGLLTSRWRPTAWVGGATPADCRSGRGHLGTREADQPILGTSWCRNSRATAATSAPSHPSARASSPQAWKPVENPPSTTTRVAP